MVVKFRGTATCEACYEVERIEHGMRRAVAERPVEPIDDLPSLVGNGGSGDVAAKLFEVVALARFKDGDGM